MGKKMFFILQTDSDYAHSRTTFDSRWSPVTYHQDVMQPNYTFVSKYLLQIIVLHLYDAFYDISSRLGRD
jgi:hypothetical protein